MSKLLSLALKPDLTLDDLIQFHYRSNANLIEIFDLPNNGFFTWVDFYLWNTRNILRSAFENGIKNYKPVKMHFATLSNVRT